MGSYAATRDKKNYTARTPFVPHCSWSWLISDIREHVYPRRIAARDSESVLMRHRHLCTLTQQLLFRTLPRLHVARRTYSARLRLRRYMLNRKQKEQRENVRYWRRRWWRRWCREFWRRDKTSSASAAASVLCRWPPCRYLCRTPSFTTLSVQRTNVEIQTKLSANAANAQRYYHIGPTTCNKSLGQSISLSNRRPRAHGTAQPSLHCQPAAIARPLARLHTWVKTSLCRSQVCACVSFSFARCRCWCSSATCKQLGEKEWLILTSYRTVFFSVS